MFASVTLCFLGTIGRRSYKILNFLWPINFKLFQCMMRSNGDFVVKDIMDGRKWPFVRRFCWVARRSYLSNPQTLFHPSFSREILLELIILRGFGYVSTPNTSFTVTMFSIRNFPIILYVSIKHILHTECAWSYDYIYVFAQRKYLWRQMKYISETKISLRN